jgi:aspartate 1-decarboxylase
MCVNGAAAHLVTIGDVIIVATFGQFTDDEARAWSPTVVQVDAENRRIG